MAEGWERDALRDPLPNQSNRFHPIPWSCDKQPSWARPSRSFYYRSLFPPPAVRAALAPPPARPHPLAPPAPAPANGDAARDPPPPGARFLFRSGYAGSLSPMSRWSRSPTAWRGGWPYATPPSPSLSRRRGSASSWVGMARRARSR